MAQLYFSSRKVNVGELEKEFMKYAQNIAGVWFIGDPVGQDAYGYVRVSSDKQAEGSGIPRQIENIHTAALREHLRVSWEIIYGDDESGMLLERQGLMHLLRDSETNKVADYLVIEDIKRLSRANRWHQGYLQEQFEIVRGVKLVFFDAIRSELEFFIKGYFAHEQVEYTRQIVTDGLRKKLDAGFVTGGGLVAFGYAKKELKGKDRLPVNVQKQTIYVPIWEGDPHALNGCDRVGPANIVVEIYELAAQGVTTRQIGKLLDEKYGPPGNSRTWDSARISHLIENTVYKGKFAAHRWGSKIRFEQGADGLLHKRRSSFQTDPSKWRYVDVPPIVSEELWEQANRMVQQNKVTSRRNNKDAGFLLTGLIFCAECGYAWHGFKADNGKGIFPYYRCSSALQRKHRKLYGVECSMNSGIQAKVLDEAVWSVIRNLIYEPESLLAYIENEFLSETNVNLHQQVKFIEGQIAKSARDIEIKYEMVQKGFMSVDEYGPHYVQHNEKVKVWQAEIAELEQRLMTREKANDLKRQIMGLAEYARSFERDGQDPPVEAKKAIIKMAVDQIFLDSKRGTMRIIGQIGDHVYNLVTPKRGSNGSSGGGSGSNNGRNRRYSATSSSSPSITNFILQGSSPPESSSASSANRRAAIWPLSSLTPRP